MNSDEVQWRRFLKDAIDSFERFDQNEIDMREAYSFLDRYEGSIDEETIVFVGNVISEIDGDHCGFLEVLEFLKSYPSPKAFREFDVEEPPKPSVFRKWLTSLFNRDEKI